jgi:hypothetical protein
MSLGIAPVALQAIPTAFPALVNPAARALAIAKRWWLTFQHRCRTSCGTFVPTGTNVPRAHEQRLFVQAGFRSRGLSNRLSTTSPAQSQAECHASTLSDASLQFDLKRREPCSIAACISFSVPNRLSAVRSTVGIELRRAGCRWRVTKPALSIASWDLISTVATFSKAPL